MPKESYVAQYLGPTASRVAKEIRDANAILLIGARVHVRHPDGRDYVISHNTFMELKNAGLIRLTVADDYQAVPESSVRVARWEGV